VCKQIECRKRLQTKNVLSLKKRNVMRHEQVKQLIKSLLNRNEDKKWPGLERWNFANFFTEDVKKNHIFPQFFGYITIYLVS
jgi:hypothetical protein